MQSQNKIFIKENMCTIYKLVFHRIQKILIKSGYETVEDLAESDVCLAGVCAAFDEDEKRSIEIVDEMKKADKPIYVFGCMTQVSPKRIDSSLQYASWRADDLIKELTNEKHVLWDDEELPNDFRLLSDYRIFNPNRKFVGISTGCSFECSYCPHKIGAGVIVSISENDILEQIEEMNHQSVDTIVLTGTDTACYGTDIGTSFASLLENILQIVRKDIDIHISQFNPEGVFGNSDHADLMLELFCDKRIKDIQLPIQTVSSRLLELMNRNYSPDELEYFLKTLKKKNRNAFLRTDLMVGFPTETIDDLNKSIDYACNNFSEIAVYTFEMKNGTPIFEMNLPLVNQEEIIRRKQHAVEKIQSAKLLVHSGGQSVETLICNDRAKESLRR